MVAMGRPKSTNLDLPPRMSQKGKAYYYVTSEGGKRKWLPLGSDKAAALSKWAELEGDTCSGARQGTVVYCLDRYVVEILPSKTIKTQAKYKRSAEAIRKVFGAMMIDAVQPKHLYQYLDRHPKPKVANGDIKLFSVVFGFAMRWGECDRNPCFGVKRHPEPPRDRYITDQEMNRVIELAPDRMRVVIEMAYITAMRKSDLLNILLSDISEEGLYVKQGKTGKKQLFEWTHELRRIVTEARKLPRRIGTFFLFTTRAGTQYSASGFDSNWKRLIKKTGIENIHFHDIRGKAITDAKRDSGIDNAQALAGHKNASMTEQYIRQRSVEKVKPIR